MLNTFSVLSGTKNKEIVFLKVGLVVLKGEAACRVSLTIVSPKECWETLSFQTSLLLFERDLNHITFLTSADRVSRVEIIYLS